MAAPRSYGDAIGDTSDFRAIFFEEADEHVAAIENILLRLDLSAPEPEDLNAIFRAAHSIKGTSGMLGFTEIASLTHVLENLLDDLRKGEQALSERSLDLMLRAGDMVKMQVAYRRGVIDEAPVSEAIEAELRALAETSGAGAGGAGPRRYAVRLGPLGTPIDQAELDLTLTGLGEMGAVHPGEINNVAGGEIRFDVELGGAEADLRSVLSLVVPAEMIHIERREAEAGVEAPAPAQAAAGTIPLDDGEGELFCDPAEWKKQREARAETAPDAAPVADVPPAAAPAAPATPATQEGVDLFVTPESLRERREQAAAQPRTPGRRASDVEVAAPEQFGRRATDLGPAEIERRGRRAADRQGGGALGDVSSIRVGIDKVDRLVNLVGELVITEAMLAQQHRGDGADAHEAGGLADLSRHTRNLQEAVMSIRMVPISSVFSRFPRLVRELSQRFGKEVELKVAGETTELDRGLIERIVDPLTHLVRNSIDHGIEAPEARRAAGKPRGGTIALSASQKGGNIVIQVRDDGRGLNRERIMARAIERGIAIAPDASDAEVWQLIFEAGFSTAEAVTDVSGRGVGMDVVRRNIMEMGGGSVDLAARDGAGTTVTVSVPLTLAIMEAMLVSSGSATYVLPLSAVIESRRIAEGEIAGIAGQGHTLRVRDDFLPVVWLSEAFSADGGAAPRDGAVAVIFEAEGGKAALVVDDLLGQQQVVVKSLEANFRRVPGVSSATIMGDGKVALILDLSHLVQAAGRGGRTRR